MLTAAFKISCIALLYHLNNGLFGPLKSRAPWLFQTSSSSYGNFPRPTDPFHFIPCTNASVLPPLNDPIPEKTWAEHFDPNPDHWIWGNKSTNSTRLQEDPYLGRPIYLCGYLDVPLGGFDNSILSHVPLY